MADELPAELEERISALENPAQQGSDFDLRSWLWLILLGLALPLSLLVWGWE
jgi:hypothetical protein